MYYKRCASGKLSILTFLYCYTLVTLSKDITEGSQSANENEHIASVFISRNACMCCIIVNSREKEDYERDIIKNIKHGKQKYDVFLFFFFFINSMGYDLLSGEDKAGATAVRFTANISYMCCVELAIKGVL